MKQRTSWVACAAVLVLTACSADDAAQPGSEPAAPRRTAQSGATTHVAGAAADAIGPQPEPGYPLDPATVLNWAEFRYPQLFPQGAQIQVQAYEGRNFSYRSYPNGNYLGVDEGANVVGIGPFTANVMMGFGHATDYGDAIQADRCGVDPQSCTTTTMCASAGDGGSTHAIGGTVIGLGAGESVELDGPGGPLRLTGNGPYCMPGRVASGAAFELRLRESPASRPCGVVQGRGVVGLGDIDNVLIDCTGDSSWAADGEVLTSALSADRQTLYIGGRFTTLGKPLGQLIPLHATSGTASGAFARVSGTVVALLPDGDGGWFIGGYNLGVDGQPVGALAHLGADGTLDQSFQRPDLASVTALATGGGALYAGGTTVRPYETPRYGLFKFSIGSGQALDYTTDISSRVNSIAVSDSAVYVAGSFGQIQGQTRNGLAAVDPHTGRLLPWDPMASGFTASIGGLTLAHGRIYVAGGFSGIGGRSQGRVAALDPLTGRAADWMPLVEGGDVDSILPDGDRVILAGRFTRVQGQTRKALAAVSVTDGKLLPLDAKLEFSVPVSPSVVSVVRQGEALYLAGLFNSVGNRSAWGLARVDADLGVALPWNRGSSSFGIDVLAVSGQRVWAAGRFAFLGGVPRAHVAAINVRTGVPTDWNPTATSQSGIEGGGDVTLLRASDKVVLAGGAFTRIGGADRSGLALLDANTGRARPSPTIEPAGREGLTIAEAGFLADVVYLAGDFRRVGGVARDGLAAVSLTDGSVLPWGSDHQDGAYALTVTPAAVYVGTRSRGERLALALHPVTGKRLGWQVDPALQSTGTALRRLVSDGSGRLLVVDVAPPWAAGSLWALDENTGLKIWGGPYAGLDGVSSLALNGDTVYTSGRVVAPADHEPAGITMSALRLSDGARLRDYTLLHGRVDTLSTANGRVWIGGRFGAVGARPQSNLAATPP